MAARDDFKDYGPQLDGPGTDMTVPVFSDVTDTVDSAGNQRMARALICTAGGNVKVTTKEGGTPTIPVLAGLRVDCEVTRVWATGTTVAAGSIILLF